MALGYPILRLSLHSFSPLNFRSSGALFESLEASTKLRLHLIEPFLLDLQTSGALQVRGLNFDVIENSLLAPRPASVTVHLVEFVVEPLGLQGILAIRLGDVLPQGHWIPQGFGPH